MLIPLDQPPYYFALLFYLHQELWNLGTINPIDFLLLYLKYSKPTNWFQERALKSLIWQHCNCIMIMKSNAEMKPLPGMSPNSVCAITEYNFFPSLAPIWVPWAIAVSGGWG